MMETARLIPLLFGYPIHISSILQILEISISDIDKKNKNKMVSNLRVLHDSLGEILHKIEIIFKVASNVEVSD